MKHLLKVVFACAVIFGTYAYLDNSLQRVQNTSIKDLTYVMMGDNRNPAYKKQQEKRLDFMLNSMKKGGFDIEKSMLESFENNTYIKNLEWNVKERSYKGLDMVTLNFKLSDNRISIPIKTTFLVKPKPSMLDSISQPDISKLYPLLAMEVTKNEKTVKFTDSQAYEILVSFYNETGSKAILSTLKN